MTARYDQHLELLTTSEMAARRRTGSFVLAVDVVRALGPTPLAAQLSLATSDNVTRAQDIMKHPPKLGRVPARSLTRTMRLGIVGELHIEGAMAPRVTLRPQLTGSFGLGDASLAPGAR